MKNHELLEDIEAFLKPRQVKINEFCQPFQGNDFKDLNLTELPSDMDEGIHPIILKYILIYGLGLAEVNYYFLVDGCGEKEKGLEIRVANPARRDLVCRLRFANGITVVSKNDLIDLSDIGGDAVYLSFLDPVSLEESVGFLEDVALFSKMEIGFFEPDIVKTQLNNCSIGNK